MTKHTRILFLLFALTCSLNARAQTVAPPLNSTPTETQQQTPNRAFTIQFESKLIGKSLPYNVLLPVDYSLRASRNKRYPVLYLLHGLTGHYDNWLERTRLADYAVPYHFIIVMPEGNDGWYSDSATVAADKYESYILQELIPDVQSRFRAIEKREARAIGGLSMGGYGALKFGLKHPEMFVFAASLSGAVNAASWRSADEIKASAFIKQSLVQTFGATADNPSKASNDLFKLARELPAERVAQLPYFYLDCGTEDQLGLLTPNRAFADLLVERKIPHEYRQLPGTHSWPYWDTQVREVLHLAVQRLAPPMGAPPVEVETPEPNPPAGTLPPR